MKLLPAILLILFPLISFSQGELDLQSKVFYRNERTFAFLLNSNGFGGNFRYGKRVDAFKKTLYEIELNYLKHPKEAKISLPSSSRNIVYGKMNATYTLKGAIGFQKEIFQKRDQGGISIRYFYNVGPSFAILKPIYYEYIDNNTKLNYYDKYQSDHPSVYIFEGKAPFTYGINETKIQPGLYGKFGFTFEYSKIDKLFHALELGVGLDAYVGKVPIMATPPGKLLFILPDDQFYLTLFIGYRFGKIIDAKSNPKQSKLDRIITR